jgi:Polyketide cyclase / dehydrase and lipid transport
VSESEGVLKQTKVGRADVRIECSTEGQARVTVRRPYAAGIAPATADHVWRIVADFGGLKLIFPDLVRLYLAYPDAGETLVGAVRDMAFDPGPAGGALNMGVERLVACDEAGRTLAYVSVLGLPVSDYRSEMTVSGKDACELAWVSTCRVAPENVGFLDILGGILASGANQIAVHLGID